ncbi:glycosyltransferase family 4 protein [Trinickia sp.]|uniref:glycosyltransferase family 4 protein n=1 Tax=Trinickia sp. TaxID=2571163 RepID=UPI003F7F2744
MRIAQVAPLYESVPPYGYGATERVVHYLTEALVALGHHVTLFATADSTTSAELVPICERGLWRDARVWDTLTHHVREVEAVLQRAGRFDVVHFHIDPLYFPIARRLPCAHVTTMHGRLLPADHGPLLREFSDAPLVSISASQRQPIPGANWQATIHHGLPADAFSFSEKHEDYLLFLGRMMPEKRPDLAIEIARRSGCRLKMAAKVHPGEKAYFNEQIAPLIEANREVVDYLGEVGGAERVELLSKAQALLFPVQWPEPFGMVMIEAMACGTPTIAFRNGAVPEVLEEGVTGYMVDSADAATEAVSRLDTIDRRKCRNVFDARFTSARMARDYINVYEALLVQTDSRHGRILGLPRRA